MNRSFFMVAFKIDHQTDKGDKLPAFSLSIENSRSTAVYSSTEIQNELVQILQSDHHIVVYDYQDGLYERLTVRDNIAFFHKWCDCKMQLPEVLVMFHLQHCSKTIVKKCSASEIRRVYYAKQYMTAINPVVYQEPIHGVDVQTKDTFMNMVQKLNEQNMSVFILTTNQMGRASCR